MALVYLLTRRDLVQIVTQNIIFKSGDDLAKFKSNDGPLHVIDWILELNEIQMDVAGFPITITSWFRQDNSFHNEGHAVDIRRLSTANANSPNPLTAPQVHEIEQRARARGIPISVQSRGLPSDHFHIGPIHYRGIPDVTD